jgi:branched-chain amino acid transport system ATP-binding protein
MLEVEQLDVAYGDLQVLWDVNLEVERGKMVALVGPNGAGKTTLLKTIAGLMRPQRGAIRFKGHCIEAQAAHEIVNLGIALVPEWKGVFYSLNVLENLQLGAFPGRAREKKAESLARVLQIFPRLEERKQQRSSTLSGGERQMLGIGRALMSQPELLILDEPSLGLAPLLVEHIFDILGQIQKQGVSILIVEQNVRLALEICDHAYILDNGRIVDQGAGRELLSNDKVREAYLGL